MFVWRDPFVWLQKPYPIFFMEKGGRHWLADIRVAAAYRRYILLQSYVITLELLLISFRNGVYQFHDSTIDRRTPVTGYVTNF